MIDPDCTFCHGSAGISNWLGNGDGLTGLPFPNLPLSYLQQFGLDSDPAMVVIASYLHGAFHSTSPGRFANGFGGQNTKYPDGTTGLATPPATTASQITIGFSQFSTAPPVIYNPGVVSVYP